MNYKDNAIKALSVLNLKPYEFFKLPECSTVYYYTFTNDLKVLKIHNDGFEMIGGPSKLLITLLIKQFKYCKLTKDEFLKLKKGIEIYHPLLIDKIYFDERC